MKVVQLWEYSCRDTVAALEHMLACALRGEIKGLAVCAKDRHNREHIAFLGDYRDNPALGVNAANRMSLRLTQLQDEMDAKDSGHGQL